MCRREQQDLSCGAVRTATLREGNGDAASPRDLVYIHYTIRQEGSSAVLATSETQHGGTGCPHAAVLEKGERIPRGWELSIVGACPSTHLHHKELLKT
jgi:hypothetical protein